MSHVIGYKLRRAQLAVFQDFIETFQDIEIRPAEFSVLVLIAENPGQKQADIASALGIKPANLVTLIDGLERRGIAERRKGDTDKRAHSLYLTANGVVFVADMVRKWQAHEDRMIERLGGTAERDLFLQMLNQITGDEAATGY